MIEYPSIIGVSKAPRKPCIAFEKLDGSNVRYYWNRKHGFHKTGTRRQMVDISTPGWNDVIMKFLPLNPILQKIFEKEFRNDGVTVFCEYFGENSFAGSHNENDSKQVIPFDIYVDKKGFVEPRRFLKLLRDKVPIPKVVYEGNLNDSFIEQVRNNEFGLKEGVVCKGTENKKVWMCKIKTLEYLNKIKALYGSDYKKYWE